MQFPFSTLDLYPSILIKLGTIFAWEHCRLNLAFSPFDKKKNRLEKLNNGLENSGSENDQHHKNLYFRFTVHPSIPKATQGPLASSFGLTQLNFFFPQVLTQF